MPSSNCVVCSLFSRQASRVWLALGCGVFSVLLLAQDGLAATYMWKDANGRTMISDQSPPGNVRPARTLGNPSPFAGASTAAPATPPAGVTPPRSMAEQEMDFRKRQQQAQEKERADAAGKTAKAEQDENCKRAQSQLMAMQSGVRMAQFNDKGERYYLDDNQREKEVQRAKQQVSTFCK